MAHLQRPAAILRRLQVTPNCSTNALVAATALNRLAYGPTPDELPRVLAIGG